MGHIVADEAVRNALSGVAEPVEIRTKEGVILGYYTPVDPKQAALHAKYSHIWDLEEVERIAATERGGVPLSEVWKEIRAQEKAR
ncbi:MAG: hypothetical protein U0797_15120 [Gemmataceae bacterium]